MHFMFMYAFHLATFLPTACILLHNAIEEVNLFLLLAFFSLCQNIPHGVWSFNSLAAKGGGSLLEDWLTEQSLVGLV